MPPRPRPASRTSDVTWNVSDWEKPTGTWPAMALATSEMGPDASSRRVSVTSRSQQADEQALDDERPAHELVRGAHQAHDLDLLGARHDRHPDGVHDDEQHRQADQPEHRHADGAQGSGDAHQLVDVGLLVDDVGHDRAALVIQDAHDLRRLARVAQLDR